MTNLLLIKLRFLFGHFSFACYFFLFHRSAHAARWRSGLCSFISAPLHNMPHHEHIVSERKSERALAHLCMRSVCVSFGVWFLPAELIEARSCIERTFCATNIFADFILYFRIYLQIFLGIWVRSVGIINIVYAALAEETSSAHSFSLISSCNTIAYACCHSRCRILCLKCQTLSCCSVLSLRCCSRLADFLHKMYNCTWALHVFEVIWCLFFKSTLSRVDVCVRCGVWRVERTPWKMEKLEILQRHDHSAFTFRMQSPESICKYTDLGASP